MIDPQSRDMSVAFSSRHRSATKESATLAPSLNILIAEDNPDGAQSLAYLLRRAGHRVWVVSDGPAAVAAALVDPPAVILMDIGLPRMDGWEAASRIRQGLSGRRCLLIAMTGYDRPADRRRSQAAGFNLHLPKPIDPEQLVELLEPYRERVRSASM